MTKERKLSIASANLEANLLNLSMRASSYQDYNYFDYVDYLDSLIGIDNALKLAGEKVRIVTTPILVILTEKVNRYGPGF